MTADVIVLGLGGMGSAAASALARRGAKVLGLEQFPLTHHRGSSHGHTRIIRTAYYEHPAYVPLVKRAFTLWRELEARTGRHLLTDCPCLSLGPPESEVVRGVQAAAEEHGLGTETLSSTDVMARYPQFRLRAESVGVLEQDAGFLLVEECVRAHLDDARAHGAELRAETPVVSWKSVGNAVEVTTASGTHRAANLVVTAGPWATRVLSGIGVPLSVMRQVQLWFAPDPKLPLFDRERFPIFLCDTPGGAYYGLPATDGRGLKCARHYGAAELPSPDEVNWEVTPADITPVREFLREYLPGAGANTSAEVCQYTLSPDRHFVIDPHPAFSNVAIACGFSGHGFKFAPTVGEILADLSLHGETAHPVDLFRANRQRVAVRL
jgi:sarcosine oxidase